MRQSPRRDSEHTLVSRPALLNSYAVPRGTAGWQPPPLLDAARQHASTKNRRKLPPAKTGRCCVHQISVSLPRRTHAWRAGLARTPPGCQQRSFVLGESAARLHFGCVGSAPPSAWRLPRRGPSQGHDAPGEPALTRRCAGAGGAKEGRRRLARGGPSSRGSQVGSAARRSIGLPDVLRECAKQGACRTAPARRVSARAPGAPLPLSLIPLPPSPSLTRSLALALSRCRSSLPPFFPA